MKNIITKWLLLTFLSLFPIVAQADAEGDDIVEEFIPPHAELVSPKQPASNGPILSYDFDQDYKKERIMTYEIKGEEQPSPSRLGAVLLKREKKQWKKVWETERQGVGLSFSGFADITGNGTKEYLFGTTIGASAGNELEVFTWNKGRLKKMTAVPYHKLEILKKDQHVSLAVWQRYIADSYFVHVLTWDGEQLVLDEELYASYYPVIKAFYENKFADMETWFYWYGLADAQIKACLFKDTLESIEKGKSIAEALSMPEIVQDFNKLKDQLKDSCPPPD